jgi:hypothetical protein
MQLQIKLQGLALPFIRENRWLVFFPKVESHKFDLIIIKKDGFDEISRKTFTFPASTKLEVNLENQPEIPSGDIVREELEKNINIAQLHEDDKPISLVADKEKYAAFLTVNGNSKLTTNFDSNSEVEYDIWKVEGDIKTRVQRGVKVKPKVASVFELSLQTTVKISASSEENKFNSSFEIIPEDGLDYEIIFRNDCDNLPGNRITDFVHYYKILDTSSLSKTFEITFSKEVIEKSETGGCDVPTTDPPHGVFDIPDELLNP